MKTKKIVALVLSIIMIFCCVFVNVYATSSSSVYSDTWEDDYSIDDYICGGHTTYSAGIHKVQAEANMIRATDDVSAIFGRVEIFLVLSYLNEDVFYTSESSEDGAYSTYFGTIITEDTDPGQVLQAIFSEYRCYVDGENIVTGCVDLYLGVNG